MRPVVKQYVGVLILSLILALILWRAGVARLFGVELGVFAVVLVWMIGYYHKNKLFLPLLRYLADHPSQGAILVLLYVLCYGLLGSGLGIANLFWSEDFGARSFTALGGTLLLGLLGVNAHFLIPEVRQEQVARDLREFIEQKSLNLPFGSWLEPRAERDDPGGEFRQAREISHLLRAARLPFLVLLLMPAVLPDVFPYANRFAPIYFYSPKTGRTVRLPFAQGWKSDIRSDYRSWGFAVLVWISGIAAGIFVIKVLNKIGPPLGNWIVSALGRVGVFALLGWLGVIVRGAFGLAARLVGWALGLVNALAEKAAGLVSLPVEWALGRFHPGRVTREEAAAAADAGVPTEHEGEAAGDAAGPVGGGVRHRDASARVAVGRVTPEAVTVSAERKRAFLRFCIVVAIVYLVLATILYDSRYVPLLDFVYVGVAPSLAMCAALGLLSIAGVALLFLVRSPRWRLAVGGVALLLLTLFGGDNQLRFEGMDYEQGWSLRDRIRMFYNQRFGHVVPPVDAPVQAEPGRTQRRARDSEALRRWEEFVLAGPGAAVAGAGEGPVAPHRPGRPKPRLAIVCVSGGASRSAYWSARALDRIGRRIAPGHGASDFHRHVRIISGASGGMVGTAYYVDWLRRRLRPGIARPDWVEEIPVTNLNQVARYIALRSPWSVLTNWARPSLGLQPYDRGIVLEETWESLREVRMGDLYADEAEGRIPTLIFSPMTVEDGRRLLITNLDMTRPPLEGWFEPPPTPADVRHSPRVLGLNDGVLLDSFDPPRHDAEYLYSLSAVEYNKFFPAPDELRLSTAVRMSASFPWVSPAVNLPNHPSLRVVDAGYYDGYGVSVAVSWAYQNREWLLEHTSGVVLVQIRDSLSFEDRFSYPGADATPGPLAFLGSGLQAFSSPVSGALKARETSVMFRNDQEVALLARLFESSRRPGFFTTVIFENAGDATPRDEQGPDWPGAEFLEDRKTPGRDPALVKEAEAASAAKSAVEAGVNVAMNWNLTIAERRALDDSIPGDLPGWAGAENKARRLVRIGQLRKLLNRENPEGFNYTCQELAKFQPHALTQYARARNYERLEALADWWGTGFAIDPGPGPAPPFAQAGPAVAPVGPGATTPGRAP